MRASLDFYTALGAIGTFLTFALGLVIYATDVRRRRRERLDDVVAQARLVSFTVEPRPVYKGETLNKVLGGLAGIKYRVVNDSLRPIRSVELELALAERWRYREPYMKLMPVVRANGEESDTWVFSGSPLSLPRGQRQVDDRDVLASIRFLDANGRWWGLVAAPDQGPHRLFPGEQSSSWSRLVQAVRGWRPRRRHAS